MRFEETVARTNSLSHWGQPYSKPVRGLRHGQFTVRFFQSNALLDVAVANSATTAKRLGATTFAAVANRALHVDVSKTGGTLFCFSKAMVRPGGGGTFASHLMGLRTSVSHLHDFYEGVSQFGRYLMQREVPGLLLSRSGGTEAYNSGADNITIGGAVLAKPAMHSDGNPLNHVIANVSAWALDDTVTYDHIDFDTAVIYSGGPTRRRYKNSVLSRTGSNPYYNIDVDPRAGFVTDVPVLQPNDLQILNGVGLEHTAATAARTMLGYSETASTAITTSPIGRACAQLFGGYVHGFHSSIKQYWVPAVGPACFSMMWTSAEAIVALQAARSGLPTENRAQLDAMVADLAARPKLILRALVWSENVKGPDIYTQSVIGDALREGADIEDVDGTVVQGRTLGAWRAACAARVADHVWPFTSEGTPAPGIGYVTATYTPEAGGSGSWSLSYPPGKDKYVCEIASREGIASALKSSVGGTAVPDIKAKFFAETGKELLDALDVAFEALPTTEIVYDPWSRLGDVWMQSTMSASLRPLICSLVFAALEKSTKFAYPE